MSPGEFIAYRLYAVYCVEIARELAEPGCKAAQAENARGAKCGIPHPHSHEA